MVEQSNIGKLKEVGQVRTFTNTTLRYFGEDPKFIKAAVEFADIAFYRARSVQFPDRLQEAASRRANRLGLSTEDIVRAQQIGTDMFIACRYLANKDDFSEQLTPEASAILERRQAFLRERAKKSRENRKDEIEVKGELVESSPFYSLRGKGTDPNEFLRDGSRRYEYDQFEGRDPREP